MIFIDLLANGSLTNLLADSAVQLIAVSILGFIAVKLLSGKSAPVRSLAAAGALASLLGVFMLSVTFHASNIAWYNADISRLAPKPSSAPAIPPQTAAPMESLLPLPDINMESTAPAKSAPVVAIKTQNKPFQLKAVHCINVLGLVWAGGIIFMLLKLGYGLAFIRGFRFGLNRILDVRIARLLKTTAEGFNKQRVPELYTSPKVESPITIGLFSPIVIIPEKLFATLSENELKSILLHELAHIYHCDHVIGVFKRIAVAVNWWNPLAYIISAKHAVAREEVADNYVLRELAPKVYSECLAGLAEKICLISSYPAAAGMAGNYSSLEQRVRSILSKTRKQTMTTGLVFKLTLAAVCGTLTLFTAGVQGQAQPAILKPTPKPNAALDDSKNAATVAPKATTSYQVSGTIPADFESRSNARGEAVFSESKGYPNIARIEIQADANGEFHVSLPAGSTAQTALRVKIRFSSDVYAPLEAISRVTPGKPVAITFSKPLKKQDTVHYFGVLLDEVTNEPVPYVGIFADSNGTEIGRADEKGHFDLYVEPWGGTTHILPYLSSDQYAGHSYFFKNNPGESVELKLIMERGVRVRVHTADEKGIAVPGVYVRWMGGGGAAGTTDKNGDAVLSGMLSRVRPGQLTEVRKEGYELANDPGQLNAILFTDKPLQIVMRKIAGSSTSEAAPSQKSNSDSVASDGKNVAKLSPQEKAQKRMLEDSKIYSKDELKSIEELYQSANKDLSTAEAKASLQTLIAKYKKANRTGCALLYLGQISKGDEQIKYLQQAIDDFGDCFYGDGVQVGPYARYYLAYACSYKGEQAKADKLFGEIKTDYPDAVDHGGNSLVATVTRELQKTKARSRIAEDAKIYSPEDLKKIDELSTTAIKKWNTDEGKESLKTLIAKYPKANNTGWTLSYFGEMSKGDEQIKYLQQAITDFSDCFYVDQGCQVGPYARLLLARIYLKKGEKADALKFLEEIKTGFPDAIDDKGNRLVSLAAKMDIDGQAQSNTANRNLNSYWNKYKRWETLRDLQKKTGAVSQKEQDETDSLMQDLVKNIYLVKFKPINGFNPSTPQDFLANFSKYSSLRSKADGVGGASFFRTTEVNNQLIGSFLTEEPLMMKADLEKSLTLQFLSGEKVTPETLVKHVESKQESLMENWKITGPKILETIPANGAKDVDPDLTKITVKFDRKMRNNSWAVCNDGTDAQLPTAGSPYYDDTSTVFTVPLGKLQPNHTYRASMNAQGYTSFVSADGTPLYPYPYTFTTKAKPESTAGDKKSEPVKAEAATAQQAKPASVKMYELIKKGNNLSAAEAAELEQKVRQNPEDIKSVTILLGYYSQRRFNDNTIRQKREKYILELIANHPEADVLGLPYGQLLLKLDNYPESKKLWLEQLEKHPNDIKIVLNAAQSFTIDDIDLAIKYFEQAIKLDPKNSGTWWYLGSAYNLKGMFGDKKTPVAPKDATAAFENALHAYENAYANSTAKEKESSFVLKPIAETALKTGKLDKAEEYANKMLTVAKNDKKDGNLVYYGNFILGMIAVKNGNIDAAGKYLLESGKSTGSPTLSSFGPDLSLARELLARGKRDIVLEFLKECSKFWQYNGTCDRLIKEMESGGTPVLSQYGMNQKGAAKSEDNAVSKDAANPETAPQTTVPAVQADAVKAPEIAKDNNSAGGYEFTINLATTAAEKWLKLVDDGKYPESWTEAAAYFKNAITAAAWEQSAKAVRPPFGKLLSRKVKSAVYHTSLPGAPDGRYVVIQFETSFENKKEAIETVTPMADPDGQWRVSGYYVK